MNRLIMASIVAVIVSYIGIAIKAMYRRRLQYLEDYVRFIDELIEEISFYSSPIDSFIDRVMDSKRRDFRRTLATYRESIKHNKVLTISGVHLKTKDAKIIQNCLNSIGRTDSNTEIFNLKNYRLEAESLKRIADGELKTRGELCSKLGILFGLALLILMI